MALPSNDLTGQQQVDLILRMMRESPPWTGAGYPTDFWPVRRTGSGRLTLISAIQRVCLETAVVLMSGHRATQGQQENQDRKTKANQAECDHAACPISRPACGCRRNG